MKHSRLKTLSFSCLSWEHKKSGRATEQYCSQWTAGSNNKHLANCGIWVEINEQHNYSVEVPLWSENLEARDCVLVPPGHPRQLDGFCLPFQSASSLRQKEQHGEGFMYSAIASILSVSQAVSLAYSSGSWQIILSGIAPSGNLAQWQPGLFAPGCCGLASGCGVSGWNPAYRAPKTLIVTHYQVCKQDLQTDLTLCSFSSFSSSSSLIFLCTASIIRKLSKGPTMKQTPQAAESLVFGGLHWGAGWLLLPTWCIQPSIQLLPAGVLHSSDRHSASPVTMFRDSTCCSPRGQWSACPLLIQLHVLSFQQKALWTHEAEREWSKAPFILLANNRYYTH